MTCTHQANHADGKIKCAALKAHRFHKERGERSTRWGVSYSVLTIRNTRQAKTLPGFSCFCELSTKGKDKWEGT